MNYIKNYLISLLYVIISIFLLTIIFTIYDYFNLFNLKAYKIIITLIPIISLFIGSFKLGKLSNKKGYLEGIKLSLIYILITILFQILGLNKFNVNNLYLYIVYILISSLGASLGINKKPIQE